MGTRSLIYVTGNNKTQEIYKHWDGYPTENLRIICDAIRRYECIVSDFLKDGYGKREYVQGPSCLAACLISETIDYKGFGANIQEDYAHKDKAFSKEHVWDDDFAIEWIYVINTDNKNIDVYGMGCGAKNIINSKVEPEKYIENLVDDAQEYELSKIKSARHNIETDTGWTINGKKSQQNVA